MICDRYMDSSVAYQGYGRGLPVRLVEVLNSLAVDEMTPDLTILLELGPAARAERLSRRHDSGQGDRIDVETERFKQRVCEGFRAIADAEPSRVVRVESLDDKEETAELIREQVRRVLL